MGAMKLLVRGVKQAAVVRLGEALAPVVMRATACTG